VNETVLEELNAMEMTGTKWLYCCLDKYLATPEAVNTELLDPRVCVQEIVDPQRQLDSLHDLFRAVRINMLLRPKYVCGSRSQRPVTFSLTVCTVCGCPQQ
jgi:hypothetical protein